MQARKLIEGASFGPDALKVITQAFADAWSEIAADYSLDQAEAARTKLALALLSVADNDSDDPGTLKRQALAAQKP